MDTTCRIVVSREDVVTNMKLSHIIIVCVLLVIVSVPVNAVLTDGLMAYYKADEPFGNLADSWDSLELTQFGNLPSVSGQLGTARSGFDASNYALRTGILDTNLSTPITFTLWFKPKGTGFRTLAAFNDGVGGRVYDYDLRIDNNNAITAIMDGGNVLATTVTENLRNDTWYFAAFMYNGSSNRLTMSCFGNQTMTTPRCTVSANTPSAVNDGLSTFSVGVQPTTGQDAQGTAFDEIGLWNRSLTYAEIAQVYNSHLGYNGFIAPPAQPVGSCDVTNQTFSSNITAVNATFSFTCQANATGLTRFDMYCPIGLSQNISLSGQLQYTYNYSQIVNATPVLCSIQLNNGIYNTTFSITRVYVPPASPVGNCTVSDQTFTSNTTSVTASFPITCQANSTGITRFDLSCPLGSSVNTTFAGITDYTYNYSGSITTTPVLCSVQLNDGIYNGTFSITRLYVASSGVFTPNTCPSELAGVLLYLGMLFFFLAIILLCLYFRLGLIGIMASIAILLYSLFVVGCYPAFGWIFAGVGLGFILYFGLGRYS